MYASAGKSSKRCDQLSAQSNSLNEAKIVYAAYAGPWFKCIGEQIPAIGRIPTSHSASRRL